MTRRNIRWTKNESPITPDPVNSPPYTYGSNDPWDTPYEDVFKMDGIAQATLSNLNLLYSGRSSEKEQTKKWYTTQLHLYGIPFKKSAPRPELKKALETAYRAGQCDELTPSVAVVRNRLRRDYDKAFKLLEDKMFSEIKGGYGEEANADPPRFLAKYFLNPQGQPDREKTKEPLSFALWNNEKELRGLIEAVPGLEILESNKSALVGWNTTMQKGIENEFKRLESWYAKREDKDDLHSAQASVDLGLFMKRYLGIDLEGRCAITGPRPSAPVTLTRWRLDDRNRRLPEEIVAKAPGLLIKEYTKSIAIVGWDASKIDAEIARLEAERQRKKKEQEAREQAEKEREIAEKKARWDRRCKSYHELVALSKKNPRPFGIQRLVGSYIVRREDCDEWESYNNPYNDHDVMKLNIFPSKSSHGLKASFCFGTIEGTMLLAVSKRELELLREEQPKDDRYGYSESPEPEESDDAEFGSTFTTFEGGIGTFRVKHKSSTSTNKPTSSTVGSKRSALGDSIADPYGVLAARAKRQRTTEATSSTVPRIKQEEEDRKQEQPTKSHRVYFQFVFNDVDGYPVVDDKNENIGHLDFDEAGLTAEGIFHAHMNWEKPQWLSIFKLSETPNTEEQPKDWFEFDGRRWGPWR